MTVDLALDAQIANDIASAASNPATAFLAAITAYRCVSAAKGASGLNGIVTALDKNALLIPAIEADITLAPVVKAILSDPAKKARFFTFLATL